MVGQEEQHLTETLVDPENLDNPAGQQWTKGEQQPPQCRDAWAAVLFYAQFIASAVVAGVLGVPAVQKYNDTDDSSNFGGSSSSDSSIDYTGLLYGELLACGSCYDIKSLILATLVMMSHVDDLSAFPTISYSIILLIIS